MSYRIQNLTARRVRIRGREDRELVLAPLEDRTAELSDHYHVETLAASRYVHVEQVPDEEASGGRPDALRARRRKWLIVLGLPPWAVIAYVVAGLIVDEPAFWLWGTGVIALATFVSTFVAIKEIRTLSLEVLRIVKYLSSIVLVLAIGLGLPLAAIVLLIDPAALLAGEVTPGERRILIGGFVQWVFISMASLLPGLMFFLFDRVKLCSLRIRFLQQIFRLDGSLETLNDVSAKYGRQVEDVYGAPVEKLGTARLVGGRPAPVVMATIVITAGWVLLLLSAGAPERGFPLFARFPEPSVLTFGFLGAYFFSLELVLRGYVRGDLRPKSYTHVMARFLTVTILGLVLQQILPSARGALSALAFVVGIFPEMGVKMILEFLQKRKVVRHNLPSLSEGAPLTNLDGIDLYDWTRLMDEGITNIESLAHHDLVDLMLQTRIPVSRLVDWVDQAILYLYAGDTSKESPDTPGLVGRLRTYGIRTATDLLRTCEAARSRGTCEALLRNLGEEDTGGVARVEVVLDALEDEYWLPQVRHWHDPRALAGVIEISAAGPPDGRVEALPMAPAPGSDSLLTVPAALPDPLPATPAAVPEPPETAPRAPAA
jgi:hypothetical protein